MDVTYKVGVRTRAEALNMAEDSLGQTKKRKLQAQAQELALSSSSLTHQPTNFPQGTAIAAQYPNFSSDGGASSCCSTNHLSATDHNLNSTDLKEESVAVEALSSSIKYNTSESGETTTSNQQAGETLHPESTTSVTYCHRQITTDKLMPSETQVEKFFAVAEAKLRKHFTDKYNYDISKDEALSGRYEWVPLKP